MFQIQIMLRSRRKQESDNDATIAGETVGDVDQHAHETETMKDNLPNLDEEEEQLLYGEVGGVKWIIHSYLTA